MDLPTGGPLGEGNTNDEPMFLSVKKLWLQYADMRSGGAVLTIRGGGGVSYTERLGVGGGRMQYGDVRSGMCKLYRD